MFPFYISRISPIGPHLRAFVRNDYASPRNTCRILIPQYHDRHLNQDQERHQRRLFSPPPHPNVCRTLSHRPNLQRHPRKSPQEGTVFQGPFGLLLPLQILLPQTRHEYSHPGSTHFQEHESHRGWKDSIIAFRRRSLVPRNA